MVAVNFRVNQIGTVAVFATLFVAISVNGEKECVLNFKHGDTDFDFECGNLKKLWAVKEVKPDPGDKKALTLQPQEEGCLRTKNTVSLNTDSKVACRLYQDANDHESVTLTLTPKEGSCPDEQCVWNLSKDPQYKTKEWVTLEHQFPVKSPNDFYIQLNVGKTKGDFYLDHITVPSASTSKCQKTGRSSDASAGKENLKEEEEEPEELPEQYEQAGNTTEKSLAPGLVDLRKNLMLTSASVLTLNHLLN